MTCVTEICSVTTLELLIELMYDGRSGLVDELKDHEPIPTKRLLEIMRSRAGRDFGNEFDNWYQWYMGSGSGAKAEEQDILENLYTFKQQTDAIVRRIKQQRGQPSD